MTLEDPDLDLDNKTRQELLSLKGDNADLDQVKQMLAAQSLERDIFEQLGLHYREDFHSNFLAWLLDPQGSHGLGEGFLRNFLARSGAGSRVINAANRASTKVTRERYVEFDGSSGRLDIQVLNEEAEFVCVIENKVWSGEGEDQLAFYRRVLPKYYPNHRIHLVFLTPTSIPPLDSEEQANWKLMSYSDILGLVEQTISRNKDSDDHDVMAFLRQYAIAIRRNIVPDVSNDVHQLARRIYRKHQAAIDLIMKNAEDYKPNYLNEASARLGEVIDAKPVIWRRGRSNVGYFRFMPAAWAKYESIKLPGWPNHLLLFEAHVTNSPAAIILGLVPGEDKALRRKIFARAKNNPEAFNCQEPHYTEDWIILHTDKDILTASDYEVWWDENTIRSKIAGRLDDFSHTQFPRINEIIVQCLEEYEVERR